MDENVSERQIAQRPGLLHPCGCQSLSSKERRSPARTPSFGKFLEVPVSPREPLSTQSTSVSTDEGIVMEDTVSHVLKDCNQQGDRMDSMENRRPIGVHHFFCGCCYSPLAQQIYRGVPQVRHVFPICGLLDDPSRRLLRMNSEEVPRTRQPNSVRETGNRERSNMKNHQRKTFESRGHSISDAQVRYKPISDEFTGIKHQRHVRKLPPIPNAAIQAKSKRDSRLMQTEGQESPSAEVIPAPRVTKPRLRRQRREYSTDSASCIPERTPSVKFQDSVARQDSASPHTERRDSINSGKGRDIFTAEGKSPVKSWVVIGDKNKFSVVSIPGGSKSVDYSRNSIEDVKRPSQSVTFDEKRVLLAREEDLDYADGENLGKMNSKVNATTPIGAEVLRNDHVVSAHPSSRNEESSRKPHQSLAEQLMAIGPTDQRRVQGIVQDVLFEMGEERILQYKSAFAKFDKDSSGIISSKQLRRLLRTLGHNPGDDELRELVNQVDMDENGKIDFNEFIIMIGYFDKANNTSEDLSHIFRVYDEIDGGSINVGELKTICSEYLIESVPLENINEMIEFIDRDGDGEINRDELCRVWSTRW